MRFYVESVERPTQDPQEEAAMLQFRVASIRYLQKALSEGRLAYAFKLEDQRISIMMVEVDDLETLDTFLKADPIFPYAENDVIPMISSKHLVEEIESFLNQKFLNQDEKNRLLPHKFTIKDGDFYILGKKKQKSFSPLLSQDQQNDIYRRTVETQRHHFNSQIERTDDNPVGIPWGIVIAQSTPEEFIAQQSKAPIFPDTTVDVYRLHTLPMALESAKSRIQALGRMLIAP